MANKRGQSRAKETLVSLKKHGRTQSARRARGAPAGNQNARRGPTKAHAVALAAHAYPGSLRRACARAGISRTSVLRWRRAAPWFNRVIHDAFGV